MPHASPAESTAPARINPPASPVAVTEHVPDATLIPLLYKELRRLAAAKIAAERVGHTLTATALVNEAYLRLHGTSAHESGWQSKAHFFGAAAEAKKRLTKVKKSPEFTARSPFWSRAVTEPGNCVASAGLEQTAASSPSNQPSLSR